MEEQSKKSAKFFMDSLDEKSRKILWYLRWHKHCKLSKLVKLIDASTDMEVLYILKEIINASAQEILGKPILEFNESKIDRLTGEKVLFSWWLLDYPEDEELLEVGRNEPLADVFDEGDQIVVVFDISPSIQVLEDTAKIEQRNGILSIRLDKVSQKSH
ncbi:hypothetical protein [Clostridium sp. BL-8]|uniref:hypothetical protein n=1 Tax=Clostridium sp. BL-8 TaxID=349938 RepID=UPI00098C59B3|nr:hypothetical protein [Clostridium sp. BL-8]OOM77809.1 hypothetical protein CLOBL_27720 [Clostridium sp. BL-8]